MTASAGDLTTPLHPTVLDALQNTPAAPLVGQPVANVLSTMGLPTVPQTQSLSPLPGIAPLPTLDMSGLLKPVTDLFSGFGTGILGANGSVNPQNALQSAVTALTTAVGMGSAGLQLLQSMQGSGTEAATSSGEAAASTSTAVAGQSAKINTTLGAAATSVAIGAAEMTGVATKLVVTETALSPLAATPGGQAALVAVAVEAAGEALAVTASTKAQLAAHSTTMTQEGSSVTVSGGTTSTSTSSSQSELEELLSSAQQVGQPLMSVAQQVIQKPAAIPASATAISDAVPAPALSDSSSGAVGSAGLTGLRGMGKPETLGAWQENNLEEDTEAAADEPAAGTVPASAVAEEPLPPIFPGARGLTAFQAGAGTLATTTPPSLITARNGKEIVGDAGDDDAPAPVIGAVTTDAITTDTADTDTDVGAQDDPFSF